MTFLGPYLVKNLSQIAHGQRPSNPIPNKLPFMVIVSLGPSHGVMIMNGMVNLSDTMGQMKFQITDEFERLCKGDLTVEAEQAKRHGIMKKAFCCMNFLCCCCPCAIWHSPTKKSLHVIK